jgi:hypothetical protein
VVCFSAFGGELQVIEPETGQLDMHLPKAFIATFGRPLPPVEDIRQVYYEFNLSQCPGAKAGGGGSITRDGLEWDHFVTLPSWEYDSASYLRWQAIEERDLDYRSCHTPMDLTFGRTQELRILICRQVDPWQIAMEIFG